MRENKIANSKEAKIYLISKIAEEAEREGIPLAEVERKQLYFSENGWTLPDFLDVNDQFEREHDPAEYEKKITSLVRNALKRVRKENPDEFDTWTGAIQVLSKEDHYILEMIPESMVPSAIESRRTPGDLLRLILTASAIVLAFLVLIFACIFISDKYGVELSKYFPPSDLSGFLLWAMLAFGLIVYLLIRLTMGAQKFDALTAKVLERVFGRPSQKG